MTPWATLYHEVVRAYATDLLREGDRVFGPEAARLAEPLPADRMADGTAAFLARHALLAGDRPTETGT